MTKQTFTPCTEQEIKELVTTERIHNLLSKVKKGFDSFEINAESSTYRRFYYNKIKDKMRDYYAQGGTFLSRMLLYTARDDYLQRFFHSHDRVEILRRIEIMLDSLHSEAIKKPHKADFLRQKYRILLDLRKEVSTLGEWDSHFHELNLEQFNAFKKESDDFISFALTYEFQPAQNGAF